MVKLNVEHRNYLQNWQKWYILIASLIKPKGHQKMSKQLKPIKLVPRADSDELAELTSAQLQRIGELAIER